MTTREAHCSCGALRVTVEGEPVRVSICHCLACQRRTGTPMSTHAHFRQEQVSLRGFHRTFTRLGERGRRVRNFFCPNCGTTLCWQADLHPSHLGVAIGAFNDPLFPRPTLSMWEQFKYSWVRLPLGIESYARARSSRSTSAGL